VQDAFGHLCSDGTLLAHGLFVVHQDLQLVDPQHLLVPRVTPLHVQDFAFPSVEFREIHINPLL